MLTVHYLINNNFYYIAQGGAFVALLAIVIDKMIENIHELFTQRSLVYSQIFLLFLWCFFWFFHFLFKLNKSSQLELFFSYKRHKIPFPLLFEWAKSKQKLTRYNKKTKNSYKKLKIKQLAKSSNNLFFIRFLQLFSIHLFI